MPRFACNLALTEPERSTLVIALRTLLKSWGESENQSQERLHARLRAISTKLEALNPAAAHTIRATRIARVVAKERRALSH